MRPTIGTSAGCPAQTRRQRPHRREWSGPAARSRPARRRRKSAAAPLEIPFGGILAAAPAECRAAIASADARCGRAASALRRSAAEAAAGAATRPISSSNAEDGDSGAGARRFGGSRLKAATAVFRVGRRSPLRPAAARLRPPAAASACDSARTFPRRHLPRPATAQAARRQDRTSSFAARRVEAFGAANDQPVGGPRHGDVEQPAVFVLGFGIRAPRAAATTWRRRRPCGPPRSSHRRPSCNSRGGRGPPAA